MHSIIFVDGDFPRVGSSIYRPNVSNKRSLADLKTSDKISWREPKNPNQHLCLLSHARRITEKSLLSHSQTSIWCSILSYAIISFCGSKNRGIYVFCAEVIYLYYLFGITLVKTAGSIPVQFETTNTNLSRETKPMMIV